MAGALMSSRTSVVQAATGPIVTIDPTQLPLPVTGTTTVTGTVGISSNTAATPWFVRSADTTTLLANNMSLTSTAVDSANNGSISLDTSAAKTVRLNAAFGSCGPCTPVRVEVYSNNFLIDQFTLTAGFSPDPNAFASRVYEVPGTTLRIGVANTAPGGQNSPRFTVAARSN